MNIRPAAVQKHARLWLMMFSWKLKFSTAFGVLLALFLLSRGDPSSSVEVAILLWGRGCAVSATILRFSSLYINGSAVMIGVTHRDACAPLRARFPAALAVRVSPTREEMVQQFLAFNSSSSLLSLCSGCQNTFSPVSGHDRIFNNKLWVYWWQSAALEALLEYEKSAKVRIRYVAAVSWDAFVEHSLPPLDQLVSGALYSSSEDNWSGINPNLVLMPREIAPIYLGVWGALRSGNLLRIFGKERIPGTSEVFVKKWLELNNVGLKYFFPLSWQHCPTSFVSPSDECRREKVCLYRNFVFEGSLKTTFRWPSRTTPFNITTDGDMVPQELRAAP
jgi:hypothetical protein